ARPGRRPLAEHGAEVRGIGELEGVQPLAQYSLDGAFPAALDAQLLPQAHSGAQAMALQPFAQRQIVLALALDLAQRAELRFGGRPLALCHAARFTRERVLLLERGAFALQRAEGGLRR